MSTHEDCMRLAIQREKESRPEDARPHPLVGAVLVSNGEILESAFRGQLAHGDHAEFTLLERKLLDRDLTGTTLYTTLEPCTTRFHPKSPCAHRIFSRRVGRVIIGMLDPNPMIYGKGVAFLRQCGIDVEFFPPELLQEIEGDNHAFIEHQLKVAPSDPASRRLDDHFHTVNSVYFDRNYYRDPSSIFAHLVEIMGGLSLLATGKQKPSVNPESFIPKAIAWWLALCGKVGVRSAEDLVWSKFPYVCPYCMLCPHDSGTCREIKKKDSVPKWGSLFEKGLTNIGRRPTTLGAWQRMFAEIYPVSQTEHYDAVFGRFTEELGELAEAVRVIQVVPNYYVSEAADVFAWLMHLANLIEDKREVPRNDQGHRFETSFVQLYPDRCKDCGQRVCSCPPILPNTLGRIAHEGPSETTTEGVGMFLPAADSIARFGLGIKPVVVGQIRLDVDPELSQRIQASVAELVPRLDGARLTLNSKRRLAVTFQLVGNAASIQRLGGDQVDNLLRVIQHLPKEEREALSRILADSSRNVWTESLQEFIGRT